MRHIVVLVTAGSAEEAAAIGQTVVDEQLAACSNLIASIASTYWWQGNVERSGEALIVLKTREDLLEAVIRRVRELHSYTVPEVIALPIIGGNPDYLQWIDDSVRAPSRSA